MGIYIFFFFFFTINVLSLCNKNEYKNEIMHWISNNSYVTYKWLESCHFHFTCDDLEERDLCDGVQAMSQTRASMEDLLWGGHSNRGVNVLSLFFFFFFCFFRAAPASYRSSQAKGQTGAADAGLHHSHSNARSLSHWARSGIDPASSGILAQLVSTEPQWELYVFSYFSIDL